MFKLQLIFLSLIPTLAGLFAINQIQDQDKTQHHTTHLTISAAISLRESLEEIKEFYHHFQPNVDLNYNFGASGSLKQQIENGAPADLFFSAATHHIDTLEKKQLLLSDTRKNILSNELVLITPKTQNDIKQLQDLSTDQAQYIGIGNIATVPAGQYTAQALQYHQLWQRIQPKIVFTKDVRSVVTYVELGNVDAGLVYRTDVLKSKKVHIVTPIATEAHEPIVYAIAAIKHTPYPKAAKDFIEFLSKEGSTQIFQKHGFKIINSVG